MVSFTYWNDCVDDKDIEAMWQEPEVSTEWLDAGETKGQKIHLSRDPDGEPYLTQTEMKAVAEIVVRRHFDSQIPPDMLRAIAELQSDRLLLATNYDKKTKLTTVGIMQVSPETAKWLVRDVGYRIYDVEENEEILFRPFVSVYFGAAHLKWLSNFEQKERTEEFVVRAYKGGTKKATHKSTLQYWKRYLSVKESLPCRKFIDECPSISNSTASLAAPSSEITGGEYNTYWDARSSPEDMQEMWNRHDVAREWSKSGEKRGKVRFSHDKDKIPYLSQIEVKAVAGIILSKYFSTRRVKASVLGALAEIVSMRFVNGIGNRMGLMGIDYSTAFWLYTELGYRAYRVDSVNDLKKPFVSMYFGAAYLAYLSEYEGRSWHMAFRSKVMHFLKVEVAKGSLSAKKVFGDNLGALPDAAYLVGPKNVNVQETGPLWLKFEQALSNYEDVKKDPGGCTIL